MWRYIVFRVVFQLIFMAQPMHWCGCIATHHLCLLSPNHLLGLLALPLAFSFYHLPPPSPTIASAAHHPALASTTCLCHPPLMFATHHLPLILASSAPHSTCCPLLNSATHHSPLAPTTYLWHPPLKSTAHHFLPLPPTLPLVPATHIHHPPFISGTHHSHPWSITSPPLATTIQLQHLPCGSTAHHLPLLPTASASTTCLFWHPPFASTAYICHICKIHHSTVNC